jgi:hypothetical protein
MNFRLTLTYMANRNQILARVPPTPDRTTATATATATAAAATTATPQRATAPARRA